MFRSLRLSVLALTALTLPFLPGCGADCVSLCEQIDEECDDDDIALDTSNCDKLCGTIDELTEDEKCEKERDEMLACLADLEDVCDLHDDCDDELDDWADCACDGDNADDCADLLG